MPQYRTTRRVQHSAEKMFDLVADVEKYPQFVPLCERLRVRERTSGDEAEVLLADMTVAYGPFRETFVSRVRLEKHNFRIVVEYIDGPFKHLNNIWQFHPASDQACDITFFIDWEMKSRLLSMTVGAVFERAYMKFAEAFERRADQVYGRGSIT